MLTRDLVFSRVTVDYVSPNFARVVWDYHRNFVEQEPYQTLIQFGFTGNPEADDWADIGSLDTNVFMATDVTKRYQSKEWDLHYRVKLVTPDGTHFSDPQQAHGILDRADWLKVREMIRQHKLLYSKYTGWEGFLLKRKRRGEIPPQTAAAVRRRVTDPLVDDIITTKRPETAGTEFIDGYFEPIPVFFQLTQEAHNTRRNDSERTKDQVVQQALCTAFQMISHNDVFVHAKSDRRYVIRPVQAAAQHRGQPVIMNVELRQVEATDPVYNVAVG